MLKTALPSRSTARTPTMLALIALGLYLGRLQS